MRLSEILTLRSCRLNRKQLLSRKREREKRQRRQNMSLVHTLLIKVKREVYILKKDVHIRARNRVEWSCLELQLVLFVLFRFAVHRQKIPIMCGMILHNVLTKTFKKWDIQWSIEEKKREFIFKWFNYLSLSCTLMYDESWRIS